MKRIFARDHHYGRQAALAALLTLWLLTIAGGAQQTPAPAPRSRAASTSPTLAQDFPPPDSSPAPPLGPSFEEPLPPLPGPPRSPLERWREADHRLRECRKKFDQIETQRENLLNKLAVERKRYTPGIINPATVLAYKAIDRLLGQLHELVGKARQNAEEAGRTLAGTMTTRRAWEPILRRGLPPLPGANESAAKEERARQELWLEAARRMDQEGEAGFAKTLLGDGFGPIALEALPERPGLNPGPRAPGRLGQPGKRGGRGPLAREANLAVRQRWLERLDRLEWRQEELQDMCKRQQREIERLRRVLEEEPPPPGANPPAPAGARQPPAPPGPR